MLEVAAALLVFLLAMASDYLETRYVRAVRAWEKGEDGARRRAATSSVLMWCVGCIGLVAMIEVGWWVILPEGAGLFAGTMLAMRR